MITNKNFIKGVDKLFNESKNISRLKRFWIHLKYHKKERASRIIVDATPAFYIMKNEEKLNELAKTCTFEDMELGPEGHREKRPVMTWASDEYRQFYNTEVISKAMQRLYDCQIQKVEWKKYKKEIDLYLGRPGIFVGSHGEFIKFIEEQTGTKIHLHETKNSVSDDIGSLCYSYCVNDIDDLL